MFPSKAGSPLIPATAAKPFNAIALFSINIVATSRGLYRLVSDVFCSFMRLPIMYCVTSSMSSNAELALILTVGSNTYLDNLCLATLDILGATFLVV